MSRRAWLEEIASRQGANAYLADVAERIQGARCEVDGLLYLDHAECAGCTILIGPGHLETRQDPQTKLCSWCGGERKPITADIILPVDFDVDALYAMATTVSAAPVVAVPLALAIGALTGVLVYVLLMRPMAGHPIFSAVLVTVSLGILLRVAVVVLYTDQIRYPAQTLALRNAPVRLPGGAAVSMLDAMTVLAAALVLASLFTFPMAYVGYLVVRKAA